MARWERSGLTVGRFARGGGAERASVLLVATGTPAEEATEVRFSPSARSRRRGRGSHDKENFLARSHGIGTRCPGFATRVPLYTQDSLSAAGHALPGGIRSRSEF